MFVAVEIGVAVWPDPLPTPSTQAVLPWEVNTMLEASRIRMGANRAIRAPNRAEVVIRRQDHRSTAAGMAWQVREPGSRRAVCRGWPIDDKRVSWLDHSRQTRPGGARPGRRMWPRSHSGPNPAAGKLPMIMEVAAVGDAMPRLKPSLLPGRQPPPALFTSAVSTKPHKTGDSAGARREKLASKITGGGGA